MSVLGVPQTRFKPLENVEGDTMSLCEFMGMAKPLFFMDKDGWKRPLPPDGYIEGKITSRENESPTMPCCGKACGWVMFGGGGFVDQSVQAFSDKLEAEDTLGSYDQLCQQIDGDMLKCHWSRFGLGKFLNCGALYWYDLVGGYKNGKYADWKYYFRRVPVVSQGEQAIEPQISKGSEGV